MGLKIENKNKTIEDLGIEFNQSQSKLQISNEDLLLLKNKLDISIKSANTLTIKKNNLQKQLEFESLKIDLINKEFNNLFKESSANKDLIARYLFVLNQCRYIIYRLLNENNILKKQFSKPKKEFF